MSPSSLKSSRSNIGTLSEAVIPEVQEKTEARTASLMLTDSQKAFESDPEKAQPELHNTAPAPIEFPEGSLRGWLTAIGGCALSLRISFPSAVD